MADKNTLQSNIKQYDVSYDKLKKYAMFLGGINATKDSLAGYEPILTGNNRLFMVREPLMLTKAIPNKCHKFKHLLEYAPMSVSGLADPTVDMDAINGGYKGKGLDIPVTYNDNTTNFTVKVVEFTGSPIRDVVQYWMNGVLDSNTSITHYNGNPGNLEMNVANEFAEFVYMLTDKTGTQIEYACLLANCFPKSINLDPFNYTAGQHNIIETEIEFSCVKYEDSDINELAKHLLHNRLILSNSMNFQSGISKSEVQSNNKFNTGIKPKKV